ncbi:diguanylate cyclase [Thiocapsa sp. UBA6158]|jgi:diguanylate cyclase (GGDEF)-like protein/hemerythrin-like metal-binding protein/PAS domain S-box-containing protein|uniref:diguanylate cyclase n=1 Tax=Thiocapsa sp. UBA6158 TaxID=1947692 RepID=UPI0025F9F892|nr:diguanylate cyclase [Thiocapsa sp. UBA6158]
MTPPPRILIVDDDPLVIASLHGALEGLGDLFFATGGAQALTLAAERPFDLILLDAWMPGMDGYATCRALHADYPEMPIIFVTEDNSIGGEMQALEAGARDLISKPINPPVVRARVSVYLMLKEQTDKLHRSEERHRLLADNASDVIWTMNLDGQMTYTSPSVERLTGFTPSERILQSLSEIFTPASLAIVLEGLAEMIEAVKARRPTDHFRAELEEYCKDGSTIWTEITANGAYDPGGRFIEILGITRDISERKRHDRDLRQARDDAETANRALHIANAELRQLASTDALTGAWNRRHFEQTAAAEIARIQRYGEPLSLILFDIDHFKSINDNCGHQMGDQVLAELTQRVRSTLRASDLLARWGGEEFVVMMPHCGETEAMHLAERIRTLVGTRPFGTIGTVTASFGVAQFAPGQTLDAWFKRVDDALYRAKEGGRNRVVAGADTIPGAGTVSLNLRWRAGYRCGDPVIDTEHHELFRLANALLDLAIIEPPPDALLPSMDALLAHVTDHFAHEEEILRRRGYADLARHAELHENLITRARDLRSQVAAGLLEFGTLAEFLCKDVVARHMLQDDRVFFRVFDRSDAALPCT